MNPRLARDPRIAILGGGITGLAAAWRIRERAPATRVTLFEAGDRLGGVIRSERCDRWLLEHGPDSLLREKPWAIELCHQLGLGDELIPTEEGNRRTLLVRDGKVVPVPDAFRLLAPTRLGPFMASRALSWRGRLRALADLVLPRRPTSAGDESLASFVRRRLGNEVLERLAQPLVGGIYTADPERLSLAATMPRFLDLERRHRSVILGLMRDMNENRAAATQASGARFSIFLSLRGGLEDLPRALVAALPAQSLRMNCKVQSLTVADAGWQIVTETDTATVDAVIVALPAPRAAEVLEQLDPEFAGGLAAIRCASTAVINLAYPASAWDKPPLGLGLVVPAREKRTILAASISSLKYAGRAPDGDTLVRAFVGGALAPETLLTRDDDLIGRVRHELADLLGLRGAPLLTRCTRWLQSMPQYDVGHLERTEALHERARKHRTLALAGNAYDGVSIADCVRSATRAADSMLDKLANEHRQAASA